MKKQAFRSKFRPEFPVEFVFDYKDPVTLGRFLSEGGRIVPSRISKLSSSQQRALTKAIKKARNLALLPVGDNAYDTLPRPEAVSPVPFEA
jgi:small subunit ribosomal protein S18